MGLFSVIKPVKQRLLECETLTQCLWSSTGREGLFVGMWCLELQTLQDSEKFSELSELCADVTSLSSLRQKNKRGGGNAASEE